MIWAYFLIAFKDSHKETPFKPIGRSTIHTDDSGFALLPCVCHGEAPLLVDVVVEQHASQQAWRVAG